MSLCQNCRDALDDPGSQALDLLAKLGNAMAGLEGHKAGLPKLVDEACEDMAEFLVTHKPNWHVLKDDQQLEEAARTAGLFVAEEPH
ncbi:hypothetical protein LCGC14_0323210 [marine sediment metagenome]|uniref:Uncharacterized protein n=1 Tax=marine sediment metagenome TaxID=412755 RepID=A0A0F9U1B7_9ZZZZ